MRGTLVKGFHEMIEKQYGSQAWKDILSAVNTPAFPMVLASSEIDDEFFAKLLDAAASVLNMTSEALGDVFGDYWIQHYAPRFYSAYFRRSPNLASFLHDLEGMHTELTRLHQDPRPLRFQTRWLTPDIVQVRYVPPTGFLPLAAGLLRAAAGYYHESLQFLDIGVDSVTVQVNPNPADFPIDKTPANP